MCELARRSGARIVLASTSEVYGDPLEHPQTECYRGNVNSTGPRSCYDEGKRGAETLCADYTRQHNIDIRIARIFNTYGPRMSFQDGRVVSNFIAQAIRPSNNPLTVYGDGTQTRSFCYVSDLVRGLITLMNVPSSGELSPLVVNLGNPSEISVLELADLISKSVKNTASVIFRPLPKDDPTRRCPDISRARTMLSWEPKVSLEEGLEKTINDFQDRARLDPNLLTIDIVHQEAAL